LPVPAAGIEPAVENVTSEDECLTYASGETCGAANALHVRVADGHLLSLGDCNLRDVLDGWRFLPTDIRKLIAATVRAHAAHSVPQTKKRSRE